MKTDSTRKQLKEFFDGRASVIVRGKLGLQDLCYVSGKDPRLWQDKVLYDDLLTSIKHQLQLDNDNTLLEVGCGAGFLAKGLSEVCGKLTGIDIAPSAIKICKLLNLANATFRTADATALPFRDNIFDRVINYDVFINISEFAFAEEIMVEMLRVVKPGGLVMIGSLPDIEKEAEISIAVQKVARSLDKSMVR